MKRGTVLRRKQENKTDKVVKEANKRSGEGLASLTLSPPYKGPNLFSGFSAA